MLQRKLSNDCAFANVKDVVIQIKYSTDCVLVKTRSRVMFVNAHMYLYMCVYVHVIMYLCECDSYMFFSYRVLQRFYNNKIRLNFFLSYCKMAGAFTLKCSYKSPFLF